MAALENIKDALRFISRNIHADFAHRFDRERIERAGFKSGAVRIELPGTKTVQPRLGHLATGAVMNANEQHFLFHLLYRCGLQRSRRFQRLVWKAQRAVVHDVDLAVFMFDERRAGLDPVAAVVISEPANLAYAHAMNMAA